MSGILSLVMFGDSPIVEHPILSVAFADKGRPQYVVS